MIEVSCGCLIDTDAESKVQKCVAKCDFHLRWARSQPTDEAYYKMLGTINSDGTPNIEPIIREFEIGFGAIQLAPHEHATMLEVGCGASMYTGYIQRAGWHYLGFELNEWAAKWTADHYNVSVQVGKFPQEYTGPFSAYEGILCAHTLEHLHHAPSGLITLHRILKEGGVIYIVVPDNTDLANPDHYWFFTPDSLVELMKAVGFVNVQLTVQQVVEREKFLYCKASK